MRRELRQAAGRLKRRLVPGVHATPEAVANYWTGYNVTDHLRFTSAEESRAHRAWRNGIYFDLATLLPTAGFDGKTVLDYGCGPGNDLVGFGLESKPARLIGVDVSASSLEESRARLALHGFEADLFRIEEDAPIPLPDASVDHVHSNGVVHHTTDPIRVLREFRRVLKPGGSVGVMVYNYESVYLHLGVAYLKQIVDGYLSELDVREALRPLTDGPGCPISRVATPAEFLADAARAGLRGELVGASVSMVEMEMLPRRFAAIRERRLADEHREFLAALTFDARGVPYYRGVGAGLNACFRLTP
jgi:SAM-dependent methyltransferase